MATIDVPTVEARIQELTDLRGVIDRRIKELEKAKADISPIGIDGKTTKVQDSAGLDALPFMKSNFGGEWLPKDKMPDWTLRFEYPLETSVFKYVKTKTGNLNRYPKGK